MWRCNRSGVCNVSCFYARIEGHYSFWSWRQQSHGRMRPHFLTMIPLSMRNWTRRTHEKFNINVSNRPERVWKWFTVWRRKAARWKNNLLPWRIETTDGPTNTEESFRKAQNWSPQWRADAWHVVPPHIGGAELATVLGRCTIHKALRFSLYEFVK